MNVAIDTNVLVYAEGLNDPQKRERAQAVLEALPPESTFLPVQVLGELFQVLVSKAKRTPQEAGAAILSWGDAFPLIETTAEALLAASDLSRAHRLGIWDALILSAAADARCRLLLSEDLHEGFTWRGVSVTNPFRTDTHPMLAGLLRQVSGPALVRSRRARRRRRPPRQA